MVGSHSGVDLEEEEERVEEITIDVDNHMGWKITHGMIMEEEDESLKEAG